jgi:hypothetical protein
LYWGWLRTEPLWHLPIESLALPMAIWALRRQVLLVGHCFYLGSLLGTAVTDFYFYQAGVMPYWRLVMRSQPEEAIVYIQEAAFQLQASGAGSLSVACLLLLVGAASVAMRTQKLHWWVFGGAVVGTIFVDLLFGLTAVL